MTVSLDRVPVDRISSEAREVRFGVTVLTLIAAVLYGLGWVLGKAFVVTWHALVWSWTAIRLGWIEAQDARPASSEG
jgi:hypothetical protein